MKKDYKQILKYLYYTKRDCPEIVRIPKMKYLMVKGQGHPGDKAFQLAAQTIFPVAYVSKFIVKQQMPEEDFVVMPMEVKWKLNREIQGSKRYSWAMMIMQPEGVTEKIIKEALALLHKKKKEIPLENKLQLQSYEEGLCGQIFHVGPYEHSLKHTFKILTDKLYSMGYQWEPDSHDVYYNDIRKTDPDKLKTLIRVRIWKQGEQEPNLEGLF